MIRADWRGPACGILAAMLFGASAPVAKVLVSDAGPVALAALFYLSAGAALWALGTRRRHREAPLRQPDVPLLGAVIVIGGIVGPVAMLYGLSQVSGVAGALLLNLEAPFTMLLAVAMFGEHLGRRALLAIGLVVAGAGLIAAASHATATSGTLPGVLALAAACLAWALDNNLTQRLSLRDPVAVVRIKTLGAGAGNLLLALAAGDRFPAGGAFVAAVGVGALGYGASIVLDTYALRSVGAAREAAYFATAPFFGALLAVPLLGETLGVAETCAGASMGLGVALLLRERHGHVHVHPALTHEHAHRHDAHHAHAHDAGVDGDEPHSHVHTHTPLVHDHPHVPDAHHRHRH